MKYITKAIKFASMASLVCGVGSASAAIVNIDLGSATSGTSIVAPGGSFAQTFAGQTVSGNAVVGSPTGPLALAPSGNITVAYWDSGVSPASNSLLAQPGNTAPLSLLLNGPADSLSWTMGFGNGGSVEALLFGATGNLVNTLLFTGLNDYANFSISGAGVFSGVTFTNNTDPAGLRFQNFSYNTVSPVPEPQTYAMLLVGLGLIGFMARRRNNFNF